MKKTEEEDQKPRFIISSMGNSPYPGHGEGVLADVMGPGDGVGEEPVYSPTKPKSTR